MEIVVKAGQFIVSLSLLIVAHELGHFVFAKLFKTRVEKFYLFFDAWFSLVKFKRGETEYGIGWLPLGGYVKISGMIDESMDTEQMQQPPQPWEFRSKPAWQRLLIMVGGVAVNFLMAFAIYAMILFTWGLEYVPPANAAYGLDFCQTALDCGFQNGDKIVAVDGREYELMGDLLHHLAVEDAREATVIRGGEQIVLAMPADITARFVTAQEKQIAVLRYPWVVDRTVAGSPAERAGIMSGDRMVAVNGTPTPVWSDFATAVTKSAEKPISLTVNRNGAELTLTMTATDEGTVGVYALQPDKILETHRIEYDFWESFPAGVRFGVDRLVTYVKDLRLVFTKAGISSVRGFIGIANIFPPEWRWLDFWTMTAFLSIILAFMNILPIPALDGGHVFFLLYELITGRRPSDKFLERAQVVGMIILLGLLLLANGNDVIGLIKNWIK